MTRQAGVQCLGLYREAGHTIPRPLACGLLGAVLSDTRSFQSPTTTPEDRRAAASLSTLAGIADPSRFGAEMLQAYAAAMAKRNDQQLITTDFKIFVMGAGRVGIAQIEAPEIDFVLQRRASLLNAMEQERIAAALGIKLRQQSGWAPGLMSRKRAVVPQRQQALR